MSEPHNLASFAEIAAERLRAHFPAGQLPQQQVLCLGEETGEFTAAYRRWAGMARRSGSWEDVEAELADVVITAYVTAQVLGIDLDAAWQQKAAKIMTRGWRDAADTDEATPEPVENFVGIFPEGWTGGLDSAAWVRQQRDGKHPESPGAGETGGTPETQEGS